MSRDIRVEVLETKADRASATSEETLRRLESRQQKKEETAQKFKELVFPEGYTEDLFNIDHIDRFGVIKLKDNPIKKQQGGYIKILEIEPTGFLKATNREKNSIIDAFKGFLRIAPDEIQFKVLTDTTDTGAILEQRSNLADEEPNDYLYATRCDDITLLEQMAQREAVSKTYLMIFRYTENPITGIAATTEEDVDLDIRESMNAFNTALSACGNRVIRHANEYDWTLSTLYRMYNRKTSVMRDESYAKRMRRIAEDTKILNAHSGKRARMIKPDKAFFAPRTISDFKDYVLIDGVYTSYLVVNENGYPESVVGGWITTYLTLGIDVDFYVKRMDKQKAKSDMDRVRTQNIVLRAQQKHLDEQSDTEEIIDAAHYLINALKTQDYYNVCTIFTIRGNTYEEMMAKRGEFQNFVITQDEISVTVATYNCLDYFKMTMPLLNINDKIMEKYKRNMVTNCVAGSYLFDEQRLSDDGGAIIGTNTLSQNLAIFNPFNTERLSNPHMVLCGTTGKGKTFTTLMLMRRFRINGLKLLCVLPEKGHEYRDAVKWLGGEFVDCSGTGKCKLNPFQITKQATLKDDDNEYASEEEKSILLGKTGELRTFFALMLHKNTLPSEQSLALDVAIKNLYAQFGITQDNNSIYDENGRVKKCPTIVDFYNFIREDADMSWLTRTLGSFVNSSFSGLCGETSGFDIDNSCVAFDVSTVANEDDLPMIFYLALTTCASKVKEDLETKYVLVMDEAWKLMANEQAAKQVNSFIRLARSYGCSVMFISQSATDMVKSELCKSLLSFIDTKIYIGISEEEEDAYIDLFKLTHAQAVSIEKQPKGIISMYAKKKLYKLTTHPSEMEMDIYETDSNRKGAAKRRLAQYEKDLFRDLQETGTVPQYRI